MGFLLVDSAFLPFIKTLISNAKSEVCLSTFKIEHNEKPRGRLLEELFSILFQKAAQGVKVKLLINWHDDRRSVAKTNLSACQVLKNHGIEVRHLRYNRCCHAKTIIVDNSTAVVGSHNLSLRSCQNNFEISYILSEPESVKCLSSVFNQSWYDAKNF
jgi:phosphatidylserine/phosphatidylglycerophosphate/cardiolipin synthase-like enzyme